MTGWRLWGTASVSTSSMISSKAKLTLWQETLSSTAAISPGVGVLVDVAEKAR